MLCVGFCLVVILFLVNFPLVWGIFFSFVMSNNLGKGSSFRTGNMGFSSCLFSYFYGVFGRMVQLCKCTECLFLI